MLGDAISRHVGKAVTMISVEDELGSYGSNVQRQCQRVARAIVALDTADPTERWEPRARARDAIAECRLNMKLIKNKLKEFECKCDSYSG